MTNQKIDILDPSGALIRQHTLSSNCVRKFSLMNEDSITLRFSARQPMKFPVGSSVGDFFITQEQLGKYNDSTGEYDYELKFDAYYWLWANKLLRYIIKGVDSARETSFTLTATIEIHASVILNCLGFLGIKYGGSPFRVDTTDTSLSHEAKLVRYENLSILGGIQAIAEAFSCEWWVIDNAIYFGRCENSDSKHVFEPGINTSSPSYSQAKSEAPNRLYVYGSDRNLPTNYRKANGNDTIGGVVVRRLMLPEGTPYLQTSPDIPENQIVEKVITLDSVYPRIDLTVAEEPETYTSDGEDQEGNSTTETFYRLKYDDTFIFSENYVLPTEELHIIFQSGLLNGMEFGAKFNPKGLNEKNTDGSWNPEAQMIEVVVNEDYGRKLPDDVLKPQKGDKFILSGWDSTKMEELGLIAAAEQELLDEAEKVMGEYTKDLSSCTCLMAWDYMKPLFATGTQPKPGDVVTIMDTAHFGSGGRKSRIIGYEYKLDKPYAECSYTCGENVSVKRLDSIEAKIDGLAKTGTKVQVQNSLDFLSKRYSDRTPFDLSIGGDTIPEGDIHSPNYLSGMNGFGWGGDNKGNFWVHSLGVRSYLQLLELITNRQRTFDSDIMLTEGDTVDSVVPFGLSSEGLERFTLKIHPEWEGYTTALYEGDVLKGVYNELAKDGQPSTSGAGTTAKNGAVYYTVWLRALAVRPLQNEVDVVMYPDDETPAGKNFAPRDMLKICRWGNAGETEAQKMRQRVIYLSSSEGRIMLLDHVTKPIIDKGNIVAVMGRLPEFLADYDMNFKPGDHGIYVNHIYAGRFQEINHAALPDPVIYYRGDFDDAKTYYDGTVNGPVDPTGESGPVVAYEKSQVGYMGCQWVCNKTGTKNPPTWDSTDWTLYLGDPRLHLEFDSPDSTVDIDNPDLTLGVVATINYQDITTNPAMRYDWSRRSVIGGTEDTASDATWTSQHQNIGPKVQLGRQDMNYAFGQPPDELVYTVLATLDPSQPSPQTETLEITI